MNSVTTYKPNGLYVVLLVVVVLAAVFGLAVLSTGKKETADQNTKTATPTALTLPVSDEAKLRRGIVLLKELHQSFLDSDMQSFRRKVAANEGEIIAISNSMPAGEPRRDLLTNSMEAYQQASLRGSKDDETHALILVAGMRRVMLEKLLNGTLTKQEREALGLVWSELKKEQPKK